jgi:acyl carrier protein
MAMSEDQVYAKVKEALVDALGVEEDEVSPKAKLMADLGAESIDLLDIIFRLERSFGITIPKGELVPEGWLSDPEYSDGVNITPKGVEEMKRRMIFADLTDFAKDPKISKIGDIFTVQTLVNFVQSKLKEKAA